MSADPLPSWRETAAKQSIVEFAAAVTHPDSPDFVPEPERVAVFDTAADHKWTMIDMAADWSAVYPPAVYPGPARALL